MQLTPSHERVTLPSGFPLWVVARRQPAEPDVGIMEPYYEIDDVRVKDKSGRVKGFWRPLTPDEERHLMEQVG